MNSLSIMKKPLESAVLANSVKVQFQNKIDCRKTDMCAVVGHQLAEFNTAISCPGKVESEDSAQSFRWCASELACLVKTTAPLSE